MNSASPEPQKAAKTSNPESSQDTLYASRKKLYVRSVTGLFANWRWALVWITQIVFYGLPWLSWNDRQAVLLHLTERKFYIFGWVFWPQDVFFLAILLIISAYALFFFTAIAGRLWCGYACPQTVYTEIFMWIEEKIEGDHTRRQKLDRAPMSAGKAMRRGAKFLVWGIVALLLVLSYPASAAFWRHSKVLRLIFGILTIVPFFWGMLALRAWHYTDNHYSGALWLLYVMILVWGADSGAYMFGKMFGKHKLAPKVSPGKTWQGFFGGLLTAAVISWAYGVWAHLDVTPTVLLVCSVVAALASVLGDLTESMFKREAGIKDSGHLIPGHGGILDRIDSLTAAVPVFACLLLLVFRTI